MPHRNPSSTEQITASTGLLAICAAVTGVLAIAAGMIEQHAQLYIAEGAIVVLLIALVLREYSARLHVRRQTRALSQKVREIEDKNRLLNLTEARAAVGHWRLDLETNRVFWSHGTFAIHGLPVGKEPSLERAIEMYHPDDRAIVEEAIASARETGDPYTFRARLIRQDNVVRHTEASALIEFNAAHEPVAMIGVFRDRTEEEEMQRDLRAARDEANALAEAKSAFLAKMSHEIRTPMNGVLGFADLLLTTDLNQSQRRHADFIAESGRVLQTLLNDILDLTKIESGHMKVDPQPASITHLIQRTAQLAEPGARKQGLTIERFIDPDLPGMVMVDALRLRQIITNLMHNAVRFTDEGTIKISALKSGDRLVIEVADTGVGIAPEQVDQVFNPFVQAQEPGDVSRGGTGLGLAICRQLTELMDGTLTVESAVGIGSTFTLSLPLHEAAQAKALTASSSQQGSDGGEKLVGRRVLMAEDFDINRELMTEMAQRIGINLEHAADGKQAVDMACSARAKGQPYELVLMDVRMPNMDGLEATRVLREEGFDPADMPIVALTANAFADDVEACLSAGMQQHLAKPISIDRLRAALIKWLPDVKRKAA